MATDIDMDIDMDLDVDYSEDPPVHGANLVPISDTPAFSHQTEEKPLLNTPNDTSEPNSLDPLPHKVHIRGLENLTTNDILAFAATYYDPHKPSHIEWIDDTSANIVYQSPDIALKALLSFSAIEISDIAQIPKLKTIKTKPFNQYPQANLEVRLAVVGDKKQAGARERSRFYLFNPEYDPAQRSKKNNPKVTKKYRSRNDGGYRSQKYDDHEQKRRERNTNLDPSFYDDGDASNLKNDRGQRLRNLDSSSPDTKDRGSLKRQKFKSEKELFPDLQDPTRGRLRNRSASPIQDHRNQAKKISRISGREFSNSLDSSKGSRTQKPKEDSSDNNQKELFPTKRFRKRLDGPRGTDHNLDTISNSTATSYPESGENILLSYESLSHGRVRPDKEKVSGINIRGMAKGLSSSTQGFAIKGAASSVRVKELFPSTLVDNSGKELFAKVLGGTRQRRKTATDLY